ncbi:Fc.00g048020.m01.CDS01 [Cosmosporella sp. VM-42]
MGISAEDQASLAQLERQPKGHSVPLISKNRIKGFTSDGQWSNINLQSMLYKDALHGEANVKLFVNSIPDLQRPGFAAAVKGDFRPTKVGEIFGPAWSTHWFKVHVTVPEKYKDEDRVEFHFNIGGEGMIYQQDGTPVHGLTGGHWRDRRVDFVLPKGWKAGVEHVFYIEASINGMFGCHPEASNSGDVMVDLDSFTKPPDPHKTFLLEQAELKVPCVVAWDLYWDYYVIKDMTVHLPYDSWEAQTAFRIGNDIINVFQRGDEASLYRCRDIARAVVGDLVKSEKVYSSQNPLIWAVGHCHIDTAWLWPFAETKRKVARSWSTQVDLMDRYPEHHFAASTAQQYKWLKEDYPAIFKRVQDKAKTGNFIPVGGSWVEFDSYYPAGESLVRQFVHGQRFFETNFEKRCRVFWIPDTFGYSAQLPQLARAAGMKYFVTQKMSWNSVNVFPHTSFKWVGLDGSQLIAHLPPTDTYTAQVTMDEMVMSTSNHKSMREDKRSLLLFGNGDGGGGPHASMLERARRFQGAAETVGGRVPDLKITSPEDFFEHLEVHAKDLATFHGEIYLESCRGCYTSQARTKLNNRNAEKLLHDLEFLATIISATDPTWKYPKYELDNLWQTMLLCHFHDVVPGSAIEMVYQDAGVLYQELFSNGDKIYKELLQQLKLSETVSSSDSGVALLNTLQWPRSEVVHIPENFTVEAGQKCSRSSGTYAIAHTPAAGLGSVVDVSVAKPTQVTLTKTKEGRYVLCNKKIQVTIAGGEITSLIDLDIGRELVPEGERANKLVLFYDQAMTYWDAWDVEIYHLETPEYLGEGTVEVLEDGPLRASLLVHHRISDDSWIKSTISLDAYVESPALQGQNDVLSQLQVTCEVDWHESRRFLKAEFPWNIHSDHATYDSQFGITRSATHYNTSWDYAKFEVVCHYFADLSEFGYGVSILNDCKYGFETQGNVQRLSLLRSPKAPDANADMGMQRFKYAIAPHQGDFSEAAVKRAGYNFNYPLRVLSAGAGDAVALANSVLGSIKLEAPPDVILETIKRGEDDQELDGHYPLKGRSGRSVIVRMYEALGGSSSAKLKVSVPVKKAFKTNLLEDDEEELNVGNAEISLTLRPFEIVTVRLQL